MIKINREFLDYNIAKSEFDKPVTHAKPTVSDLIIKQIMRNSNHRIKEIQAIGSLKSSDSLAVAVVGSRSMSRYGKAVIKKIVTSLVKHKITIVSGLMYGVDIEAHKTAIENGGRTIGVLGYGFDYLLRNKQAKAISEDILNHNCGAVVSEYNRALPGSYWTFPRRNNIIVALSRTTVVIEAANHSGTSITAGYTNKQNKPVFSVPGSIFNKQSVGANKLIKDGAMLIDSVDDILNHLNLSVCKSEIKMNRENVTLYNSVLKVIGDKEVSFLEVLTVTGFSVGLLNMLLTKLELSGILSRSISGSWYRL